MAEPVCGYRALAKPPTRWQTLAWRARRYLRRAPRYALRAFFSPILDAGQAISALAAWIGLYIILGGANDAQRDQLAIDWAASVTAFGIAFAAWLVVCVVLSPLFALSADWKVGRWYGNRFVYRTPQLLAAFRCKATGELERFYFKLTDVEPEAFIYHRIEIAERVRPRLFAALGMDADNVPFPWNGEYGKSYLEGGVRAGKSLRAILAIKMMPGTISQDVRVYCTHFFVGPNADDHDGETSAA